MVSLKPWYRATLKLQADSLRIGRVTSGQAFSANDGTVSYTWFSEPAETLDVAAEFVLPEGQKLLREIRGTYTALPIDLSVTSGIADVEYETRVVLRDTLALPGPASLP